MNRVVFLYVGIVATVIVSFAGLVSLPEIQLRDLAPIVGENGEEYPVEPQGLVLEGRRAYAGLGCMYCHSQQIRPEGFGSDLDRGWGSRRTVARDHIYDAPPLLGTMRTGPDLVNIGVRQPSDNWHLLHLYSPEITSPGSTMPPMPFLFENRSLELETPYDALAFPPGVVEEGTLVVPRREAKAIVAYLKSLNASRPVPEVVQ
ncbi:MAG: cytochrome-c oxidase [bacterium]|nr:cytochrome-c oxidase [bacterium]